jgi:hypothetical protein
MVQFPKESSRVPSDCTYVHEEKLGEKKLKKRKKNASESE